VNEEPGTPPKFVYCTGRGTLQHGDLRCRVNACETTDKYIVYGTKSAGNLCYHTCFTHEDN